MVLEEISMIKNELLVGYTREAEEVEEAAAPAMPATTTPARPAAFSAATGPALTAETVRYAPPEAAAASATAASAAVAAAMAQAEQLQWRTAAYPSHVGGGSGGGGGGDDVVWGEIVTGEPVGGAMGGAMGGGRLPSALLHVAPPQLCIPVPPLVPSSAPAGHLPQGYLPSFAPVPSGPAPPPPLLAQPQSQPHVPASMLLPPYAAAGGYSGVGSGGGGGCGLDFSMPPPGGGVGYGVGGGGGGACLTAPQSQLAGAGAGALPSDLAQLNLMSMGCGSSLQPAAPPPRAPPPAQGYEMRTAGLDFSMPGLCAPCAPCATETGSGAAIAPGVPATILALERHAPAPTPSTYPTALPPGAQPLTAPVGAGGLRALLVPRSTARVFLQLAADNTARNIETCAILVGKLLPSGLCVDRLLVPCQTGTANTCNTTDENEIYECRLEDRTHRAAAPAAPRTAASAA